jgi:hypothetical protein
MMEQDVENGEWYVTGAHTRRAVGYLGAHLAEHGYLPDDFEQPQLLEIWAQALLATVEDDELSPIDARHLQPAVP